MKLKRSTAWLTLICLCQGCIFTAIEHAPTTDGMDQGAEEGGADMSVEPLDLASPDDSASDADMRVEAGPDMEPDAGDMGAPDQCPSVASQCQQLGFQCGVSEGHSDQCAPDMTLNCGGCEGAEPLICREGQCVRDCTPREIQTICDDNKYECGTKRVMECDVELELNCGGCEGDADRAVCTADNLCCDKAEQLLTKVKPRLLDEGKCGAVIAQVCGEEQEVLLETSCDEYAQQMGDEPGSYQCVQSRCVCRPQTDAELCQDAGRVCGMLPTKVDRCGTSRPGITCPDTCTGLTHCCPTQNVCKLVTSLSCD